MMPVPAGRKMVRQLMFVNGVEADELTLAELHASVLSEDALSLAQEGDTAAVSYAVCHVSIPMDEAEMAAASKVSAAAQSAAAPAAAAAAQHGTAAGAPRNAAAAAEPLAVITCDPAPPVRGVVTPALAPVAATESVAQQAGPTQAIPEPAASETSTAQTRAVAPRATNAVDDSTGPGLVGRDDRGSEPALGGPTSDKNGKRRAAPAPAPSDRNSKRRAPPAPTPVP
ncbi:unnamed protein product, partial [Ectocarpus fasciculatus]